jgi:uncharacterized membrane protein
MQDHPKHAMETEELHRLAHLRQARRHRRKAVHAPPAHAPEAMSLGARVSDTVAKVVGSWRFIIIQSVLLVIWMILNVTGWVQQWDPYPFILLNLALSFQAAYTAPIIMMSQNRQSEIDRQAAQHDYDVNIKAELEIELLHQKVDMLREKEISELIGIIRILQNALCDASGRPLAQIQAVQSAKPTN